MHEGISSIIHIKMYLENPKEINHLINLDVDGRIYLNWF
jgi:hypothetical protein